MIFIRTIALALLVSLGPLLVTNLVLENYAEQRARAEMQSIAKRYISQAERAITQVVSALQELDENSVNSCSWQNRRAMGNAVGSNVFVHSLGLADEAGVPMCAVPAKALSGRNLLPAYSVDSPRVGLGLMDQDFRGVKGARISWAVDNGWRLFAEISPLVMDLEPGPEYLRKASNLQVRLGADALWVHTSVNSMPVADGSDGPLSLTLRSSLYPISAKIESDREAILELVYELKIVAAIACASGAIFLVMVGVWFSWRPDSEAEDEFIAAIRNNEFIPYYQPVVDISTGELLGCEVLMRWQQPNGVMIPPGKFMPYAEATGHIFEMTRRLMVQTIDEVGDLYSRNPKLKLSINLFAGHFNNREIIRDIKEIYGASQIPLSQIVLEVTERQPLQNVDLARKIIAELQSMEVRVALDDVGTGHGGLAYLQKLGVDIVKIDRMFVDPLGTDQSASSIAVSIVELADNLNMGIIAEGVETYTQMKALEKLGVSEAQGYLFAKPLPVDDYLLLAHQIETGTYNPVGAVLEKQLALEAERLAAEEGGANEDQSQPAA
nr:EAL domain-containing protein [Pseudovibrio flavus]